MTRPLRVNIEGAWYHITARGTERRQIFEDRRDHEHFLELLAELPERFGIEIHAYALMGNHYHLLIRAPHANASSAMQWLNASYSMWFNRRRGRVGPLFQGRFHSTLVDGNGSWALSASVYIHLNPIRTSETGLDKSSDRAEATGVKPIEKEMVQERLRRLRAHLWSSCGAYAGYSEKPAWLTVAELQKRAGGASAYRRMVHAHVTRGALPDGYEDAVGRLVRGSRAFLEAVKERVRSVSREQPARREILRGAPLEAIVAAVEKIKGESWEAFKDRHGDDGRDLTLYLARRRSGLTLREIGERLAVGDYKTVSKAVERFEKSLARDAARRERVQAALAQLSNVET